MVNLKKIEKIFSLIEKNRKLFTLIVLMISILIIALPFVFFKGTKPISSMTKLEISKAFAEIISAIFVISGSFVAVSQYWITSKSSIIKMDTERINKGIDLANFYKEKVLTPYSMIKVIYKEIGLFDALRKEKNKMKKFTNEELTSIFSDEEIKSFIDKQSSEDFIKSLIILNDTFNLNINGCETVTSSINNGKGTIEFAVNTKKALTDFYSTYVSDLLNNVELFAMYFTHNVADESVIYQSIYPTYIELCQTLYFDISKCSVPGQPMLYRNLNQLYLTWLKKMNNSREKINDIEVSMGQSAGQIK